MAKRNIKIVYSNYAGPEKKALEPVYRELEEVVLRDGDRYVIHVLACERADAAVLDKNAAVPRRCEHRYHNELFTEPLPDYEQAFAPKVPVRNIFTWGHPITDYREYIDNMARLRFNELIVWNDFVPLNAREIVDYAHEYGIRIVFGYAWGWSRTCGATDITRLDALADEIVATYERDYAPLGLDGIYFQSFTEMNEDRIGGRLVAEVVTEFVNDVSARPPL